MAEYLTLAEAAKLVTNPLQKGVIEIFARTSPVLERMPFQNIAGQALVYNQEQTLPGIGFRAINSTPTPDQGIVNPVTEKLMVLGGISQVDRALVKMQGNVNDLRATHDGMKAKAAALEFTRCFFKGDTDDDPTEFDGLEQRIAGAQRITYTDNLLEALDATIDAVVGSPDMLFMNKTVRRQLNAAVRSAGQAIETVSGAFGQRLEAYAGIPIGVIEEDSTGAQILGFDEDGNTTSIYAVRFGVGEYLGGIQSGGIAVEDLGLADIFYKTLVEWIVGMAIFHPRAAARLQGVPRTDEYGQTTTTSV
jgi:Major capsid protein GP7